MYLIAKRLKLQPYNDYERYNFKTPVLTPQQVSWTIEFADFETIGCVLEKQNGVEKTAIVEHLIWSLKSGVTFFDVIECCILNRRLEICEEVLKTQKYNTEALWNVVGCSLSKRHDLTVEHLEIYHQLSKDSKFDRADVLDDYVRSRRHHVTMYLLGMWKIHLNSVSISKIIVTAALWSNFTVLRWSKESHPTSRCKTPIRECTVVGKRWLIRNFF